MNLLCPSCPERFEVSEEDPDATLSDLWAHLGRHTTSRDERTRLFTEAQESPACGPHCGIAGSGAIIREGHCNCEICHDGDIPPWARDPFITIEGQVQRPGRRPASTPMCERQGTDYAREDGS